MEGVSQLLSMPQPQLLVGSTNVERVPVNKELDEATRTLVGSVFYGTLLKTMRESEMKGEIGHGGRGEEAFGAQLDAMLAERAGQATHGGVAGAIYKSLARQQGLMDAKKVSSVTGGEA